MLLLSWWVFVFAVFLFFAFLPFFLSLVFGSGMPGCCLHTAVWLLVLLSVGINASFPAQRQGTLSAVHPGCLQHLVRKEKESTGCHPAGPASRLSHTLRAGRQRPARWAARPALPMGLQCHTCAENQDMQWCESGGMAYRSKATPQEDRSGRSCVAASSSLQGSLSCNCSVPGSWPSPQGQIYFCFELKPHTFRTTNQQTSFSFLQRLLWSCTGSPGSRELPIPAHHPLRHCLPPTPAPSLGPWAAATTHCDQSAPGVKNYPMHMQKEDGPDTFICISYTHIIHTGICTHSVPICTNVNYPQYVATIPSKEANFWIFLRQFKKIPQQTHDSSPKQCWPSLDPNTSCKLLCTSLTAEE